MPKVMNRCPVTYHAISTGIEVKSDAHTDCPKCGNDHPWSKRDAWIEEAAANSHNAKHASCSLPYGAW